MVRYRRGDGVPTGCPAGRDPAPPAPTGHRSINGPPTRLRGGRRHLRRGVTRSPAGSIEHRPWISVDLPLQGGWLGNPTPTPGSSTRPPAPCDGRTASTLRAREYIHGLATYAPLAAQLPALRPADSPPAARRAGRSLFRRLPGTNVVEVADRPSGRWTALPDLARRMAPISPKGLDDSPASALIRHILGIAAGQVPVPDDEGLDRLFTGVLQEPQLACGERPGPNPHEGREGRGGRRLRLAARMAVRDRAGRERPLVLGDLWG